MTSEALYERYKDALKRGHVASLRGRTAEALTAYAEAAAIAPERSTPHTSAGTALLRRERPADALRHYDVALRISARDEAALLGRAQALAALDRRPEAADAFDALAESRAASGKLADAVDAARRGLELAEGRDRRRTLERLINQLRATDPGEPGRLALEHALQVLEGQAVRPAAGLAARVPDEGGDAGVAGMVPERGVPAGPAVADTAATRDAGGTADAQPGPGPAPEAAPGAVPDQRDVPEPGPEAGPGPGPDGEPEAEHEPEPEPDREPEAGHEPEPEPEPVHRRALDRDLADVPVEVLALRAEAAMDAGIPGPALESLLDLAAAYRRDGQIDAALDACYLALSMDPDHAGLHLAQVELYDERGWAALATDKLDLLTQLAELDDDADAKARIAAARSCRG